MALYTQPQLGRRPVCSLPVLERRQVELEQQLARQRLERRQPCFVARNSLHFSPHLRVGLSFSKLAVPAAKIPTDLIHLLRDRNVFCVIKRLRLPEHHEQYFERVHLPYCQADVGLLLFSPQEARNGDGFDYFNEQPIHSLPERMPVEFGENLVISVPQDICTLHQLK